MTREVAPTQAIVYWVEKATGRATINAADAGQFCAGGEIDTGLEYTGPWTRSPLPRGEVKAEEQSSAPPAKAAPVPKAKNIEQGPRPIQHAAPKKAPPELPAEFMRREAEGKPLAEPTRE